MHPTHTCIQSSAWVGTHRERGGEREREREREKARPKMRPGRRRAPREGLKALGAGYFNVFQFQAKFGLCPKSTTLSSPPAPSSSKKSPQKGPLCSTFSFMLIFPEVAASLAVEICWGILDAILRGLFPWCLLPASCLLGRSVRRSALQWQMRVVAEIFHVAARHPSAVV